jgi:hypothetical protein
MDDESLEEKESLENQLTLFDLDPEWKDRWEGMPEYIQEDLSPLETIYVHFATIKDKKDFEKLVGQKIHRSAGGPGTIWFPKAEIGRYGNKRYKTKEVINPHYPVYVISKGRWESRLTSKALEVANIPYHIVIEPQEYDNYSKVIDPKKILVLPFSNLGEGSIPARNWVWEHSMNIGVERHWILDDNIDGFFRLNNNLKIQVDSGAIFRAAEDFTDRYENIALSGFNYFMFAIRKDPKPPFILNTRIYSCILINNNIPYRWRGRYNEDTDLSLRALKDGWCSVLFNAFLARKAATMTMSGGNTDDLYKDDGRFKMAQSLQDQHPDLVKIVWKWDRWQHQIDYHIFDSNRLILKPGIAIPAGIDNYGMELIIYDTIQNREGE